MNNRQYQKQYDDSRIIPLSSLHCSVKDISGQKYSRLTAMGVVATPEGAKKATYWLFACDCGGEKIVKHCTVTAPIYAGATKGFVQSCGCLAKERMVGVKKKVKQPTTNRPRMVVEIDGVIKTPSEWAKENHMAISVIYDRIRKGIKGKAIIAPVNYICTTRLVA